MIMETSPIPFKTVIAQWALSFIYSETISRPRGGKGHIPGSYPVIERKASNGYDSFHEQSIYMRTQKV
jgi:hypothetical protein